MNELKLSELYDQAIHILCSNGLDERAMNRYSKWLTDNDISVGKRNAINQIYEWNDNVWLIYETAKTELQNGNDNVNVVYDIPCPFSFNEVKGL